MMSEDEAFDLYDHQTIADRSVILTSNSILGPVQSFLRSPKLLPDASILCYKELGIGS